MFVHPRALLPTLLLAFRMTVLAKCTVRLLTLLKEIFPEKQLTEIAGTPTEEPKKLLTISLGLLHQEQDKFKDRDHQVLLPLVTKMMEPAPSMLLLLLPRKETFPGRQIMLVPAGIPMEEEKGPLIISLT